jgi:hypothetical protein
MMALLSSRKADAKPSGKGGDHLMPIHLFQPLAEEAGLAALAVQMNSERAYECFPSNASNAPRCELSNAAVDLVPTARRPHDVLRILARDLTSAHRETGLAPTSFFFSSLASPRPEPF